MALWQRRAHVLRLGCFCDTPVPMTSWYQEVGPSRRQQARRSDVSCTTIVAAEEEVKAVTCRDAWILKALCIQCASKTHHIWHAISRIGSAVLSARISRASAQHSSHSTWHWLYSIILDHVFAQTVHVDRPLTIDFVSRQSSLTDLTHNVHARNCAQSSSAHSPRRNVRRNNCHLDDGGQMSPFSRIHGSRQKGQVLPRPGLCQKITKLCLLS